jgi:hypothetical protein
VTQAVLKARDSSGQVKAGHYGIRMLLLFLRVQKQGENNVLSFVARNKQNNSFFLRFKGFAHLSF